MNIIVCMKEVRDPDASSDVFKIDMNNNTLVSADNVLKVVNPFDEQAVEAALRIKDKTGAKVIVLNLGHQLDLVVARKPLLMGADEFILLDDEGFVGGDSWSTAHALAMAIKKIGSYDLILCGRQAADSNAGQVGLGIAQILGIPCVTIARKIEVEEGKATVEKVTQDGYEIIEMALPALVTVSSELGQPRYPSIKRLRAANSIQPLIWKPADIGLEPSDTGKAGRRAKILRLYQPVREVECEFIEGETIQEAAENLALRLRSQKII
ncbi:MAG: electron transfer flavoprotein subunit beta/FixA family protein [Deltaproteobacteria bacterium]|nr:electron transfer flavoprotein subunit beta/FixA family protein [Deltaproteobacteria bacterium]